MTSKTPAPERSKTKFKTEARRKNIATGKGKIKKAPKRGAEKKAARRLGGKKKTGIVVSKKFSAKKQFKKFEKNPIIAPRPENSWEAWQTFNPGAVLLNDSVHFLYRAVGNDGMSRLGYASSKNGFIVDERLSRPAYEHGAKRRSFNVYSLLSGGSWGGCEDPRITRVDNEDTLYVTYTAATGTLGVALTSIKINDFLNKKWTWKRPVLISPPWQIHKNWVIFPEKINGKYAILHSINPEILITYVDSLDFDESADYIESYYGGELKNSRSWDGWVRGVGPPPIKTGSGWLVFYHAMENGDWSKYKVGAMLLDLENPKKVLYRSRWPVLEPSEYYEMNGFKGGVVYASGAVVKNGNLILYYGGADNYVCAASAPLKTFLNELISSGKPKFKKLAAVKSRRRS